MRTTNLAAAASMVGLALLLTACGKQQSPQLGGDLKRIGSFMAAYAAGNNDTLPSDMGPFVHTGEATFSESKKQALQTLAGSDVAIPQETVDASPEEQGRWLKDHSDFAFLAPGHKLMGAPNPNTTPLVIQRPELLPHAAQLYVLYHDGHVELRPRAEVEKMAAAK